MGVHFGLKHKGGMEVELNSKAFDQAGVPFCSSNHGQDLLLNQTMDRYDGEDKEGNREKLLADGESLNDTPNQQTQPSQNPDATLTNGNEMSLEKDEKKSCVDQYGISDLSKQGLHQISSQLLPRLANVQMLYLQVTLL